MSRSQYEFLRDTIPRWACRTVCHCCIAKIWQSMFLTCTHSILMFLLTDEFYSYFLRTVLFHSMLLQRIYEHVVDYGLHDYQWYLSVWTCSVCICAYFWHVWWRKNVCILSYLHPYGVHCISLLSFYFNGVVFLAVYTYKFVLFRLCRPTVL